MPQDTSKKKFPSIKTKNNSSQPDSTIDSVEEFKTHNKGSKTIAKKITAKTSTSKILLDLESQLLASKQKLAQQDEQLVFTQKGLQEKIAEVTLMTRQHELDVEQKVKSSKKKLIEPVVTYINNVVLAFQYLPQGLDENVNKFIETLKLALQRAISDLQKHGVEIIIPEVGELVDPIFMNVLNPGSSQSEELKVQAIVSVGVKIDGQITQPVSVMAE
jgi:molecular chaperone GrpE (heat shock protein)